MLGIAFHGGAQAVVRSCLLEALHTAPSPTVCDVSRSGRSGGSEKPGERLSSRQIILDVVESRLNGLSLVIWVSLMAFHRELELYITHLPPPTRRKRHHLSLTYCNIAVDFTFYIPKFPSKLSNPTKSSTVGIVILVNSPPNSQLLNSSPLVSSSSEKLTRLCA